MNHQIKLKLYLILFTAILFVATASFVPTAGADAGSPDSGSISVAPTSGHVGDSITVSGSGLTSDHDYQISILDSGSGSSNIGTVHTDLTGDFSDTFTLPDMYGGAATVRLFDLATSSFIAQTAPFTVIPSITLSPTSGPAGTEVIIYGRGFSPDADWTSQPLTVFYAGNTITTFDYLDYGFYLWGWWPVGFHDGNFAAMFTLPTPVTGVTTLTLTAASGNLIDTATAEFTTTTASFSVSDTSNSGATSGYVGDTLSFSGSGLAPSTTYDIYLGDPSSGGIYLTHVTTDDSGQFDGTFSGATATIPHTTGGLYYIQLIDDNQLFYANANEKPVIKVADATFNVLALTLTPTNGPTGTVVTIQGNGFVLADPTTDGLSVTLNGVPISLAALSSTGQGDFEGTYTIPTSITGTCTFRVTDDSGTDMSATMYQVTLGSTGLGADASGDALLYRINGGSINSVSISGGSIWVDAGSALAYEFYGNGVLDPVSSTNSGKQYRWASTSGTGFATSATGSGDTLTVNAVGTITGNFQSQYNLQFAISGVDSSATDIVVSVTVGSASTVDLYVGDLSPYNFGYVDAGTTITYTFTSIVSSSDSEERFVLTTPDASPANGFSLNAATTVTGTYLTQWQITPYYTVPDDSSPTVTNVVHYTSGGAPETATPTLGSSGGTPIWVDADTAITYDSPISGATGERWQIAAGDTAAHQVLASVGSSQTITTAYIHQYSVTFGYWNPDSSPIPAGTVIGTYASFGSDNNINSAGTFSTLGGSYGTYGATSPATTWVDAGTHKVTYQTAIVGSERWSIWASPDSIDVDASYEMLEYGYYHQIQFTLNYAVSDGGSPTAPTLTSTQYGYDYTPTLTTTPTAYWLDNNILWSITNPLSGATGTERYGSGATLTGTVTAPATISPTYYHQYKVTFSYTTNDGSPIVSSNLLLYGPQSNLVTYTQGGVTKYLDTASSGALVLQGTSTPITNEWVDEGSAVTYLSTAYYNDASQYEIHYSDYMFHTVIASVDSTHTTANPLYYHQVLLTFQSHTNDASVPTADFGSGPTTIYPYINFVSCGVSMLTQTSLTGSGAYCDIGTTYYYDNTNQMPDGTTERWYASSPTSGTVTSALGGSTFDQLYYHQYQVTFTASGTSLSWDGSTTVTVAGNAKAAAALPFSDWYTVGSTIDWAYSNTVSSVSSPSDTRYLWASTSGLSQSGLSGTLTVNSAGTVTGAYTKQYKATFTASGVTSNAAGLTLLTVGGNTYTYNNLPSNVWFDSGTLYTWANPVIVSASERFIQTSGSTVSGTITASTTVNKLYYHQYATTFTYGTHDGSALPADTVIGTYKQLGADQDIKATATYGSAGSGWVDTGASAASYQTYPYSSDAEHWLLYSPTSFDVFSAATITTEYYHQYLLTVSSAHGTVTGEGWYNASDTATFSVTSPDGAVGTRYVLTGWSSSNFDGYTGTASSPTVTMNGPVTETANWKTQYQVTFVVTPLGSGLTNPSGANVWEDAGSLALMATKNVGYTFFSWSSSGSITFDNANAASATATISGPGTITATFTQNQAANFELSTVNAQTVGSSFTITVTVKDAAGNTIPWYTGTIHFSSSDSQAQLPTDYTFQTGDAGVKTFTVTLKTVGSYTITVTDTLTSLITGTSNSITVNPSTVFNIVVSTPSSAIAGTPLTITVTAEDAYDNIATGYTGTVHFSSTDSQAILPSDATLTGGVGIFTVTLKSAGSHVVSATDAANAVTASSVITVNPAAASRFIVSAPSTATAGTAITVTVTAKDAYGNTATGYTGIVHFSSSDSKATLPSDSTLTNGIGTFTITLKTAAAQTVTATDTSAASITGNSGAITVSHATAASAVTITPAATSITAGTTQIFTATAADPYGNTWDVTPSTTWSINSTAGGSWSSNTYTSATAGSWMVTGTYAATAYTTTITINPGEVSSFVISASPSATAGTAFSITITAKDSQGNTATSFTGTVTLTPSQGTISPISSGVFTAGAWIGSVTLNPAGSITIRASDSNNHTGQSSTITLAAAPATATPIPTLAPTTPPPNIIHATTNNGTVDIPLSGNITTTQVTNVTITTISHTIVLTFNLTGQSGTVGFSNMTISKSAVPNEASIVVYIDGQPAADQGYTQDANNYYVWYTTHFSAHQIKIEFIGIAPTATPTTSPTNQLSTELPMSIWEFIVFGIIGVIVIAIGIIWGFILPRRHPKPSLSKSQGTNN